MKVYLLARYGRRHELREYTSQGNSVGLENTGTWIYQDEPDFTALTPPEVQAKYAQKDLDAIWQAQAVVLFTEDGPAPEPSRGGMHTEFGAALAWRKKLIVVGPALNLFHHWGGVRRFATWAEALEHLRPKSEYCQQGFFESIQPESP